MRSNTGKVGYKWLVALIALLSVVGCHHSDNFEKLRVVPVVDVAIHPDSEYFVVLGDVQTYVYNAFNRPYLERSLEWIYDQHNFYHNFLCLLQDGDVTETNSAEEWEIFYSLTEELSRTLLTIPATGNHDYSWDYSSNPRFSTRINDYLFNSLLESRIEDSFQPESMENIIVRNSIHGQRYDIIALEFAPRPEVLVWADSVVSSNPARKYFLMTHEFLYYGKRIGWADSYANLQFCGYPACSPDQVWDRLVSKNDNIVAVLCGHNGFCEQLESPNDSGRMVPQILFNLQYQKNGGDTMVQLWEFPPTGDTCYVNVYHTYKRFFLTTPETNYKFRYRY